MQYAIIENQTVTNIIEANGPLPGLNMVPIPTSGPVSIGYLYINGHFYPPNVPPPPAYPPDTEEQHYLEYKAMIYRRADALEAQGKIVQALLLRESVK